MDIDTLLKETTEAAPCGPNLEYSAEFLALENAFRPKGEQMVEGGGPAVEVDWNDIRVRAEALLARTKDLRVAMTLLRALTHTDGLPGFAAGLTVVSGLLDRYWEAVHPRLDAADGNDPTMRLSALAGLAPPKGAAGEETLLADLRGALVVPRGAWGAVSVRDVLAAAGKLPGGAPPALGMGEIEAIVRRAAAAEPGAVGAARSALDTVARLQSGLIGKVGVEQAPDLQPLRDMLKIVADAVARATAAEGLPPSGEDASAGQEGPGFPGAIRSREDALRALEQVCMYLERAEPANPAPLLIRRAQRVMTKSFVEIIEDLAPEGLAQVRSVAGIRGE